MDGITIYKIHSSPHPPTDAPKLYLDGLLGKKLKVRAGEPIDIKIPMSGAPQPACEWSKGKTKIEPSKRTSVSCLLVA